MTRNLVMRTTRDSGQCHPCIHLRRCDSLAGTAGGEAMEMCKGAGVSGQGGGGSLLHLRSPCLPF